MTPTKPTPPLDTQDSPATVEAPPSSGPDGGTATGPSDLPPAGSPGEAAPAASVSTPQALAVVALCCVLAWLVLGSSGGSGEPVQVARYLDFAATAPVAAVVATFDEGIRGRCDPQLLAMLIKALPERYGAFQGARPEGFTSSDTVVEGGRRREYVGDMLFQRGQVPLKVAFLDEKLVSFMIRNEDLARALQATRGLPPDLTPYQSLGERFWRAAIENRPDEAFALMSEPLRTSLGRDGFAARCADLASKGAITSLTFVRAIPHAQYRDRVHLLYRITAERGGALGHVTFQFAGVNSYLIAFQIPSSLAPSDVAPASAPAGPAATAPVPGS